MAASARDQGAAATSGGGPDQNAALADLLALAPAADRARLAGLVASRPQMAARGVQLAREAYRAQARLGPDDPRTQELLLKSARQAVRIARVDTELSRAQITTPAANPDGTVIWGRVSEGGKPVVNVTVSARGAKGEVEGYGCTDANGGYAMTVLGALSVQLRVTDAKEVVLYAGTEELAAAPGAIFYRDIEISGTPVDICQRPADDPAAPAQHDTVKVPGIVGRSEAEAARLLTAVGLKSGERTEAPSDERPGTILRQTPDANAEAPRGSAVAIRVAVTDKRVVPVLAGHTVAAARAALDTVGLSAASVTYRTDPRRAGVVVQQAPPAGARVDPKTGIKLTVALPGKPIPAALVLDLVALDARFQSVRLPGDALAVRAIELGLQDRRALIAFAGADDASVRDRLGLPALRDARTLKRVLRDVLAKTD